MTERSAPSLVDLAHAAEQAIARYVDAADKACAAVGEGMGPPASCALDGARLAAFQAIQELWLMPWPAGSAASLRVLHDMRALIGAGIVRPEWGLRVVQIAAAEQARKEAERG